MFCWSSDRFDQQKEICTVINNMRPRGRSPSSGGVGSLSKQVVIALLLVVALFAFEVFNFDTTEFALESLLGTSSFVGVKWATVLAVAFCAIDFAGLARIFTPESGGDEPKEIWYLTGAWLMGATMNAVMTWWAVSITLLDYDVGNEILSRDQILSYVPIFVAVLVWLTRIMFIGAMSVAGEQLLWGNQPKGATMPVGVRSQPAVLQRASIRPADSAYMPSMLDPTLGFNREERPSVGQPTAVNPRAVRPRTRYRRMETR